MGKSSQALLGYAPTLFLYGPGTMIFIIGVRAMLIITAIIMAIIAAIRAIGVRSVVPVGAPHRHSDYQTIY